MLQSIIYLLSYMFPILSPLRLVCGRLGICHVCCTRSGVSAMMLCSGCGKMSMVTLGNSVVGESGLCSVIVLSPPNIS